MAVPKGKVSKQRRNKRRSSVWKLATPGLVACPKCGALHLPHRMCPECGTYNGREVKRGQVCGRRQIISSACVPDEEERFSSLLISDFTEFFDFLT